jgi:hypothetical protein
MSEQNETERQRQERAKLVSAFNKRAWQRSEQPQLAPRVLAGGAALIVVAGAAFGLGALNSYSHKKTAEQRTRQAALSTTENPGSQNRTIGETTPTIPPHGGTPQQSGVPQQNGRTGPGGTTPHNALPQAATGPVKQGSAGNNRAVHSNAAALPKGAKSSAASGVVIKNVMTGMCVDIPDFGKGTIDGRVQQHTCDGSSADNQRWDLVVGQKGAGPNGADLFTIRNTKDGYCLDLPGYGTADRADVTEWYCDPGSGDNEMWYLQRKSSGEYWIRNVKSPGDECLDVAGLNGSGGQDAKLTIYPCSLQDDHLWSFLR